MFGGKELVSMHGLNEYDFAGRWQDPLISSFTSIDPLCEKYYSVSPYVHCLNNLMNVVDPDGRDDVFITFADYMVNTETCLGKQPLGHSGVLLIDNKIG